MHKKSLTNFSVVALGLLVSQGIAFANFPDVPSNHPNEDAINYAQAQGIISGYADGSFRADQTINRAEFTKIVTFTSMRGLPTQGAGTCFSDMVGDEWFAAIVCWAKGSTAISGYPDGTFRPSRTINFAEAAKIMVSILSPGMSPVPLHEPWYRPYIQYLGEQGAIPTTIQSFDQNITRGEMVEILYRLEADIVAKPSRTYEEFPGFSGWMSYVNADINVIFDCPVTICGDTAVEWRSNGTWRISHNDHPLLVELNAEEAAQEALIIEDNVILSDERTNQGGRKVIFEVGQMGGISTQAMITCGTRTLLFPGVIIDFEGEEAWHVIQRMLDSMKFTRC